MNKRDRAIKPYHWGKISDGVKIFHRVYTIQQSLAFCGVRLDERGEVWCYDHPAAHGSFDDPLRLCKRCMNIMERDNNEA